VLVARRLLALLAGCMGVALLMLSAVPTSTPHDAVVVRAVSVVLTPEEARHLYGDQPMHLATEELLAMPNLHNALLSRYRKGSVLCLPTAEWETLQRALSVSNGPFVFSCGGELYRAGVATRIAHPEADTTCLEVAYLGVFEGLNGVRLPRVDDSVLIRYPGVAAALKSDELAQAGVGVDRQEWERFCDQELDASDCRFVHDGMIVEGTPARPSSIPIDRAEGGSLRVATRAGAVALLALAALLIGPTYRCRPPRIALCSVRAALLLDAACLTVAAPIAMTVLDGTVSAGLGLVPLWLWVPDGQGGRLLVVGVAGLALGLGLPLAAGWISRTAALSMSVDADGLKLYGSFTPASLGWEEVVQVRVVRGARGCYGWRGSSRRALIFEGSARSLVVPEPEGEETQALVFSILLDNAPRNKQALLEDAHDAWWPSPEGLSL
jgi:hypothetical protein